ncbi:MAG TPA: cytochrome b/b6 domain-containing protein [Longimicrobiales bacterium]|nr:cytochrome b/b6 domain-containing protein [Longimicrobiales bacterium]
MNGYPVPSRIFHWLVALMVVVQLLAGIAMTSEGFDGLSDALYITHKGLGVLILGVLAVRLAWRVLGPPPPPLPEAIPPSERRLAVWTHRFLYLLVAALAVTGYLRTVGGGFPIELLDALGIPPLVGERPELATALSVIHKFLGYVLVAVVAVHAGAVIQNTFLVRNRILWRMWPPWGRSRGE